MPSDTCLPKLVSVGSEIARKFAPQVFLQARIARVSCVGDDVDMQLQSFDV